MEIGSTQMESGIKIESQDGNGKWATPHRRTQYKNDLL